LKQKDEEMAVYKSKINELGNLDKEKRKDYDQINEQLREATRRLTSFENTFSNYFVLILTNNLEC
jgi:hypothetical protein